jgi:hypothetical protein
MLQEPVLHATKDTNWSRDNVFNQPSNNQLIWDARPGIGTDKFASNAQPDGLSTQRESVFQFLTTAINGMLQEPVFHVILVTTYLTNNVKYLLACAKQPTLMDHALLVTLDTFYTKVIVPHFQN